MNLTETSLAFLEGIALILSPCILPILPIVLSSSLIGGKQRPYGIITGFILTFSAFALTSHFLINAIGVDLDFIKNFSLVLLVILSLLLIFPSIWEKLSVHLKIPSEFTNSQLDSTKHGFWTGILIGGLIGVIWTPCAGPIMAAALVQIIRQKSNLESLLILVSFSAGAGIPMLIIALTGRSMMKNINFIVKHASVVKKILGILILLSVGYIAFGMNTVTAVASVNQDNTQYKNVKLIHALSNPYPAPEFSGITAWINSPALTMASLKGKVVLVDFWTYSCINCIRTLPYLLSWDQKYKDEGLVIVGVHAPEFEFEKKLSNVQMAVEKFHIQYPVALDSSLKTWDNFHNVYWPAHYLIDKQGNIVYTHFGEGDYQITEQNIRTLLNQEDAKELTPESITWSRPVITPETYLGKIRRENYDQSETGKTQELPLNHWTLKGQWDIQNEKIITLEKNASIRLHFIAKKVYLVMGASNSSPIDVKIFLNGNYIQNITVKDHLLYELLNLPSVENADLELQIEDKGLEAFAFTFGN